jgi:hypothetical protein
MIATGGVVAAVHAPSARAANQNLDCTSGSFYSVLNEGTLGKVTTGANGTPNNGFDKVGQWKDAKGNALTGVNSLGIAPGGGSAYALLRGSGASNTPSILKWTKDGGFAAPVQISNPTDIDSTVRSSAIAGAVSQDGKTFYFGGWGTNKNSIPTFYIYKVDLSGTSYTASLAGYIQVVTGSTGGNNNPKPTYLGGTNGDFAFDSAGNMYVILSPNGNTGINYIVLVKGTALSSAGGNLVPSEILSRSKNPTTVGFNGIAFDSTGGVLAQGSNSNPSNPQTWLAPTDSNSMNVGTSVTLVGSDVTGNNKMGTDLGGCLFPGTIKVQKNYVGRANATDQVTLSLDRTDLDSGDVADPVTTHCNNSRERLGHPG